MMNLNQTMTNAHLWCYNFKVNIFVGLVVKRDVFYENRLEVQADKIYCNFACRNSRADYLESREITGYRFNNFIYDVTAENG